VFCVTLGIILRDCLGDILRTAHAREVANGAWVVRGEYPTGLRTRPMFRSLGANIWDHEMPIRFGGIPLWHRMTVIRLTNGGLVVHSPTRLDLASQEEFQRLGPIVAIIAPSWWHDLYLREYLNAYPNAKLYGAPTLVR
jgi:hypothetical protein